MEVSKAHADGYNEGDQDALVEDAAALASYTLDTQSSSRSNICLLLLLSLVFLLFPLLALARLQRLLLRLCHDARGILSQPSPSDNSTATLPCLVLTAA